VFGIRLAARYGSCRLIDENSRGKVQNVFRGSSALRHQLGVLSRSNRRFRTSDRLFWLCLRRAWPRWREALVLVQPATVDCWHREGFCGWWRRPSRRRPGRPRIDAPLRSLIERMATANGLWGAPRIHGELLKLGFTVCERTVSRYLPDRRTRPSQTWRTFLANHIGALAFTSTVSFATSDEDDSASALLCPPTPPSCAERPVSTQWAMVDAPPAHRPTSLGRCVTQDQLRRRTRTRFRSGKDPPRSCPVEPCACDTGLEFLTSHLSRTELMFGSSGSDIGALRRHQRALCQSVPNFSRGSRFALCS
jgi:hypothetical protein